MNIKRIRIIVMALICGITLNMVAFGANNKPRPTPTKSPNTPEWIENLDKPKKTEPPKPSETSNPNATPDPNATPTPTPTITPKPTPIVKKNIVVPILLYHHITREKFDKTNSISLISPEDFRKHMTAIKVHYTPISLRDYYEYVECKDGSKTIPENSIVVTFDDGYSSNYEIAYPILKELEIPATIFVVTDTVGARAGEGKVNYSHFTWEEAKIMEDSGLIEIQSHTDNHVKLATMNYNNLVLELRRSKYLIEKNLNRACDMIAFPYGSYNDQTLAAAQKAGYKVRLLVGDDTTDTDYEVNLTDDGVGAITRITVSGSMGNVDVLDLIRKAIKQTKIN
ncbi:MAG: polysaccharide deacetylase family protein [Oscillospiraceae bacterium]